MVVSTAMTKIGTKKGGPHRKNGFFQKMRDPFSFFRDQSLGSKFEVPNLKTVEMAVWRKQTNKQNTKTGDNLPLTGGIRLWCFNTEHDITSKVIDRFTKTNPFQKAKKSVYAYQKPKIKILCKNSNEKAPKEQVTRKKTLK